MAVAAGSRGKIIRAIYVHETMSNDRPHWPFAFAIKAGGLAEI
jgi:hypothetical protein